MVGYTFGNHVLRLRLRVAVKLNFQRYTSPNENFEYSYPLIANHISDDIPPKTKILNTIIP